jgi:hypothetical protein
LFVLKNVGNSYVSLLGLNGVTEAFVRAAISHLQQYRLNLLLIVFSVVHVISCTVLLHSSLASVGLVYANCLGMLLRLSYSFWFIRDFFPKFPWRSLLPPKMVLLSLFIARVTLSFVSPDLCSSLSVRRWASLPALSCMGLVSVAVVFFVLICGLEFLFDKSWLVELRELWRGKISKRD